MWAIDIRRVDPAAAGLQNMHDAADHPSVIPIDIQVGDRVLMIGAPIWVALMTRNSSGALRRAVVLEKPVLSCPAAKRAKVR